MVRTGNFSQDNKGGTMQSYKGVLYGIPVYTTNQIISGLQTYRNLLAHSSAFGFAIQRKGDGINGKPVRVQTDNLIQNLGMLTVVDIVYGVAVLREPLAVLLNASSAFLGS